jgi:hypothetical protein
MSYTTVTNVAGMFPAFKRGTPQQNPQDSLIQTYVDDVAGDIDAVLARRFGESIQEAAGGSFTVWVSQFSLDAQNVLERINRYGAAAQLGETLASFGVVAARDLAQDCQARYSELLDQLSSRDKSGRATAGGLYDHLFDSQALTESPRAGLTGVAGGDQPAGQTPADTGSSQVFGKFDRRGT